MKPLLPLIVLAASLGATARAQQIVFHDGFENGLSNWTASGLWNLESSSDPCGGFAAPFVEGTQAAWYGIDGQCNYDTPGTANSGALTLNSWITLPVAPSISLRFWNWIQTENCVEPLGYDLHWIRIEAQNGPNPGFDQLLCPAGKSIGLPVVSWYEWRIDLSAYAGAQVRFRFEFDTVDQRVNTTLGWLIDAVSVIAEPGVQLCSASGVYSGCPCAPGSLPVAGGCPNSNALSATLLSGGLPSLAVDSLTFTAAHMALRTVSVLLQASTAMPQANFGDGFLCLAGSPMRLGTQSAASGIATWPSPSMPALSVVGLVPPGGGTRFYQVVYRDALPYCTPATFNVTDAERVVWIP